MDTYILLIINVQKLHNVQKIFFFSNYYIS